MAGKRQPTALVEANGRKHLTAAEADARRDQEVYVAPPEAAVPPLWLPKKLHKEFREIGEILLAAGLYSELDRDVLGQYFLARERWLRADKHPEHLLSPGPPMCGVHGALRHSSVPDRHPDAPSECRKSRTGGRHR